MKIFSVNDLRQIDQDTIRKENISSLELMERAATAVVREIVSQYQRNKHICIFAGPGNNGGDALAVARLLLVEGYNPEIYLFKTTTLSNDCESNLERLKNEYPDSQLFEITNKFNPPKLTSQTLVVDGIFGTGMTKVLTGGYTALVKYINESDAFVISIDVPTGLTCGWDQYNEARHIINANITYTFQYPKLPFFFRENAPYVGHWKVLNIGLQPDPATSNSSRTYCVEKEDAALLLKSRDKFADKKTFGHALLTGGRFGMVGAITLAAKAAMHSGVGLTTVHAPKCAYNILQTSIPEAIYEKDEDDMECSHIQLHNKYKALGIGPGMGHGSKPSICLRDLLTSDINIPVVFDADALRIMAINRELLDVLPYHSILTPHKDEFEDLFDSMIDSDSHRFQQAILMAKTYNIIIVLKGAHTAIASPSGELYLNNSGNNGMATAGSGDVLTGIITSLLAQGYEPINAAVLGVHLHGLAGDIAAAESSPEAITAQDIIACLGKAFRKLRL